MKYSRFPTTFAIVLITAALGGSVRAEDLPPKQAARKKPNFLLIMGDDIGRMNVSAHGGVE
jgi:hypothetical protein